MTFKPNIHTSEAIDPAGFKLLHRLDRDLVQKHLEQQKLVIREGHVKRSPANKWWVYQRNLDWFRFWLKGEEDPDPAKAEQYARWRELRKLQDANEKSASAVVH